MEKQDRKTNTQKEREGLVKGISYLKGHTRKAKAFY